MFTVVDSVLLKFTKRSPAKLLFLNLCKRSLMHTVWQIFKSHQTRADRSLYLVLGAIESLNNFALI